MRARNGGLLAAVAALAWVGSTVGQPVTSLACRLMRHPNGLQNPPSARTRQCACAPLDQLPRPVPGLHGETPVYVAIPKTGSTSVAHTLQLQHTHLPAAMRSELADGTRFGFAVVRHPLDRLVAWYRFCIHGHHLIGQQISPARLCRRAVTAYLANEEIRDGFTEFLTTLGWNENDPSLDGKVAWGSWAYALWPQTRWVQANDTSRLLVEFVLRFEELESDFKRLQCALGHAPGGQPLRHDNNPIHTLTSHLNNSDEHRIRHKYQGPAAECALNLTKWPLYVAAVKRDLDRPWEEYYDERSLRRTADRFRSDLETFGYQVPSLDGTIASPWRRTLA